MLYRRETVVINTGFDLVRLEKGEDRIHLLLPVDFENAPESSLFSKLMEEIVSKWGRMVN